MFPAKFLANPPPTNALLARFDAWLNLSHLEKATVFVSVRTKAIAILRVSIIILPCLWRPVEKKLTHNHQPYRIQQPDQRQHRQCHPQRRRSIHAQPEEAPIRRIDDPGTRFRGFKHPVRIPRRGVDLVPPPQSDEAAAGDVFQVVEIEGQEEQGEYEDEDARKLIVREYRTKGCCR